MAVKTLSLNVELLQYVGSTITIAENQIHLKVIERNILHLDTQFVEYDILIIFCQVTDC